MVSLLAEKSSFWRAGWSDDLVAISVKIDTPFKYFILLLAVLLINVTKVIVDEFAMPILGFYIYNPDKREIYGFGGIELQVLANGMYFVSGLRGIFLMVLSIT